ncbi:putative ammonium permease ATO3 [Lachancea thermotolerans CBS 6340]|uniref:KLTH0F15268p n=1 Tax=Lachancea thermotolerans (strain ATCC 56472 / CBS 6340 / NRRL Y-8284) TaxID=559295 RepID=C5DJC4_LACTC|nr:KLTH0F15268p [Lachancea thermotolerans CBS 6340]CAR24413.1 KLTH0F15268p [Lachancea thermotolerans CBS 6340]
MVSDSVSREMDLEKGPTQASYEEAVPGARGGARGGLDARDALSGRLVHAVSVDGDFVHLGDRTYRRAELANAFAGELNPGIHPRPPTNLANPVPLGLASFSYCALVLSLLNAQVRGVTNGNIVITASLFFGGCIELFAGLLCYPIGNTYAMTVFGSFGGFWISYGALVMDQFGILASYADEPEMMANAMGFFLAGWTVFTFLMLMCTLKSTWGLFLLFFFLELTFLMLTIGAFVSSENVTKAAGYFGILSSVCGWYSLYSGIADPSNSYFPIRAYYMPNAPTV